MKKNIIIIILVIVLWVICFIPFEKKNKNFTGPMGYEMQYIRTISETEMEYRDEQTGIHYIVSNDFAIKNPIYKNSKLECLKTN